MQEKTLRRSVILWICVAVVLIGVALAAVFFLRPQWKQSQDGRCYLRYGQKLFGWQEIHGQTHYFDPETGFLKTGLLTLSDGTYFLSEDGQPLTGWQETPSGRLHFGESGRMTTGWLQESDGAVYLDDSGKLVTGWLKLDTGTWYLKEDGHPYTGWMQTDEARYYFLEDGSMAVGSHEIGGISRYFSSDGNYIPLVNPWHAVPEDYKENLVAIGKRKVDSTCAPALQELMAAAEGEGLTCKLNSTYRDMDTQIFLWDRRYNKYRNQGYSKEKAHRLTARRVAYPGTSEHHTGLAIDIFDVEKDGKIYDWLRDHAWEYGFVVRYRGDKESITGIMNEPWHIRYVGKEVSKILYEKDLCLEEFLGELPPQE